MSEEIKPGSLPGSLPGNLPEEPMPLPEPLPVPLPMGANAPFKKNPRRVEAGKKGAEAKRIRALLRKKELEEIKEENQRLHMREVPSTKEPVLSVTKEPVPVPLPLPEPARRPGIKLPTLLFSAGIIGSITLILASYFFRRKPIKPRPLEKPKPIKKPEIDPFEF